MCSSRHRLPIIWKSCFSQLFHLKTLHKTRKHRTFVQCFPVLHLLATQPGADGRIRTGDLLITNQLLYQLSYTSAGRHGAGRPSLTQMIVYHSLPAPSRRKLPSAAERRGWASSAVPGARGGRRGLPRPPREGPRGAAGDMQRRADITSCISASFPSLFRRSFCRNPFQSAFPRLGAVSQNSTNFDIFLSFPGKMFGRRILHNFFDNSFYQK